MRLHKVQCALAGLLMFAGAALFAESAQDIAQKTENLDIPLFSEATLQFDIYEKGKLIETRLVKEFGQRKNNLKSVVFDFKTPANMKGTRVLQAEKKGKFDDRWIYMPSLRTTRRIPSSEGRKSWLGTDFTYDDMAQRKAAEDTHEMVSENESVTVAGTSYDCYKIKSVPVEKRFEFIYRIQYIDRKTLLPVKVAYYGKDNKIFKIYTIEKIESIKGADGKPYLLRRQNRMASANGHETVITVKEFVFGKAIDDHYFTQNWLNTGK